MSDWGGYRRILEEAKEEERAERSAREVACPLCGTPLAFNSQGLGNCPLGHYRQSRPNQTQGEGF